MPPAALESLPLRTSFPALADCDRAFDLLAGVRDVVAERPDGVGTPTWCLSRGWDSYLLGLSEQDLETAEGHGLAAILPRHPNAPRTLVEHVRDIEDAIRVPQSFDSGAMPVLRFPGLRPRKERQVAAMLELGRPLAERARRLVDVGAGRGRFTEIAAQIWNRPAVGIEREPMHVHSARADAHSSRTEYHCIDVSDGLPGLGPEDLVLGLHACGELGDAIVRAAAAARGSLILVACCHQKIRGGRREPLSRRAASRGLTLARDVLGLANLTTRSVGFEYPLSTAFEARTLRHALAHLLRGRGIELPLDALRHAVKRRTSFADWPTFARQSLETWGLPPASAAELDECLALSISERRRMRRLSLPRNQIARLMELAICLDRACYLCEAGLEPAVVEVFNSDASPRNLALVASAPRPYATIPSTTLPCTSVSRKSRP